MLWDFGNTLADETFVWQGPPDIPGWRAAFERLRHDDLMQQWDTGVADLDDVAASIAQTLGLTADRVAADIEQLCHQVHFYPAALALAARLSVPQAIVTVNPAVFRPFIVEHYHLHDTFEPIVISAEEHTTDKSALCEIALAQLGLTQQRHRSILIDNLEAHVAAWRARGGLAYQFLNESQFSQDQQTGALSILTDC